MSCVQAQQDLMSCSIGEVEIVGTDRIALRTDSEKLAFDCNLMMVPNRGGRDLGPVPS